MSLLREVKIKSKALEVILINSSFEQMIREYLLDSEVNILDKADITEWLEKEGLGDYV